LLALIVSFVVVRAGGSTPPRAIPRLSHVVVVVMENREYDEVIGNPEAPYINTLAKRNALAARFYALTHPSLPNYLGLLGGSTFGVHADCTDCHVDGRNLVDQLEAAGISWKAYMEGMPTACFRGAGAGRYVKRHNPFAYFDDIARKRGRCRKIVPLRSLSADLRRQRLPRLAWISPDLCHDMHDCGVRAGDRFLQKLLPRLLHRLGSTGVLFLTWDEGRTKEGCCAHAKGGHIPMIAAGPAARRGARSSVRYDHYSLLRTVEEGWRLPHLGEAGCPCTRSMRDLFRSAQGP
jgi:phospholipase C